MRLLHRRARHRLGPCQGRGPKTKRLYPQVRRRAPLPRAAGGVAHHPRPSGGCAAGVRWARGTGPEPAEAGSPARRAFRLTTRGPRRRWRRRRWQRMRW
eukprot:scaffold9275_cov67-Isochrysis_galbana.AAC.1